MHLGGLGASKGAALKSICRVLRKERVCRGQEILAPPIRRTATVLIAEDEKELESWHPNL